MLGFDGEHPVGHRKAKCWSFFVEKSAVKHSIEKPILLSFINFLYNPLSKIVCGNRFLFLTQSRPSLILHFLKILIFRRTHSLFKLTFRAMQLLQRCKYNILKKYYFARQLHVQIWDQTSFQIKEDSIYDELLFFFAKNMSFLENFENFSDNLWQKNCRFFWVLGQFLFTVSETELDYYHQKVKIKITSQVADLGLKT